MIGLHTASLSPQETPGMPARITYRLWPMEEKEIQSRFERFQIATHEIIFEADSKWGKVFDVALIVLIVMSVLIVMMDSIEEYSLVFSREFYFLEWCFTIIFTAEYLLRLLCVGKPLRYALSFYGIVDLLAVIPTYLSLFITGSHYLLVIRLLRVLRVFRVLKIAHYVGETEFLMDALHASRRKIFIFLFTVMTLATIAGSLMYVIEGAEAGYTSIPKGIYWAVVTLTTVGYGDISPQTTLGQIIATLIMLMGYGIIAVPTGIVTVEFARAAERQDQVVRACRECGGEFHARDAKFCKHCGEKLP